MKYWWIANNNDVIYFALCKATDTVTFRAQCMKSDITVSTHKFAEIFQPVKDSLLDHCKPYCNGRFLVPGRIGVGQIDTKFLIDIYESEQHR